MTDAYVQDLCRQLNDLASLVGKSACIKTRSGKVQVDHSFGGQLWRKLINSEDESRFSTVSGIESLFATVNDYVASTLKIPPIVRNIVVSNNNEEGKVVANNNSVKTQSEKTNAFLKEEEDANDAVKRAQLQFFEDSNAQTKDGLRALSLAAKECCKGIADLISRRYCTDYEIVAFLVDELNFATMIASRIDNALKT